MTALCLGEKKKEGGAKKEVKKEVKVEPEPEPEDLISLVKSRRLMAMQAKKEKEELDRQNRGNLAALHPIYHLFSNGEIQIFFQPHVVKFTLKGPLTFVFWTVVALSSCQRASSIIQQRYWVIHITEYFCLHNPSLQPF